MAEAYVPLFFAPGEAYQFDWSHEVVLIGGATVTIKVAHVRLEVAPIWWTVQGLAACRSVCLSSS